MSIPRHTITPAVRTIALFCPICPERRTLENPCVTGSLFAKRAVLKAMAQETGAGSGNRTRAFSMGS